MTALGHGIPRVHGQVQNHLFNLTLICLHSRQRRIEPDCHLDVFTDQAAQHLFYVGLEAVEAVEALRVVKNHAGKIHLLLTDVVMPGMSGRALAEHVVALLPHIKVLFMSGYTDFAIGKQGDLVEGAVMIQKPFTRESLLCKVREVLESDVPAPSLSLPH